MRPEASFRIADRHEERVGNRRGPAKHTRRDDVVIAANSHFRKLGYAKTTVGALARSIGCSTAYVYKFFDSKQAIAEAIVQECLTDIVSDLERIVASDRLAADRMREVFRRLSYHALNISLREGRLHELVVAATHEQWQAFERHQAKVNALVLKLLEDGRHSGEFERRTDLSEMCRSVLLVMEPLKNPVLWAQRLDEIEHQASALSTLVERSLAFQGISTTLSP